MRYITTLPLRIYQLFSSIFTPRCKYYPSCSNYAITAIRRYGRLLRCNPWSHGGVDYVDEELDSADAKKHEKEVAGAN
jgi:uncharacterized protein